MEYQGSFQVVTEFQIVITDTKEQCENEIDKFVENNIDELLSVGGGDFSDFVNDETERLQYVEYEVSYEGTQEYEKVELY